MTALVMLAVIAAAPIPKAASQGRITLWVGDALIAMNPDGSDIAKSSVPRLETMPPYDFKLCQDQKTLLYRRYLQQQGINNLRLVIASLDPKVEAYELEGCVPWRYLISPDGRTIYVSGPPIEDGQVKAGAAPANWSYDVAAKKLTKLPHPERMFLDGVSPDGKVFLVGGPETKDKVTTWQNYFIRDDRKKTDGLLASNSFTHGVTFSPLGDRFIAHVNFYPKVVVTADNTRPEGVPIHEMVLIDVTTRQKTVLTGPVADCDRMAWSPNGLKIAYIRHDAPVQVKGAPAPREANSEYRLFVADPDGSNPVEIYKMSAPSIRALQWQ